MKMYDEKTGERLSEKTVREIALASINADTCIAAIKSAIEIREEIFHRRATDKSIMKRFAKIAEDKTHFYLINTAEARELFIFTAQPANNFGFKTWPLPNVILSVKVSDQQNASARIPLLMVSPANLRVVDFRRVRGPIDMKTFDNPAGAPLPKEIHGIIINPNAPSKLNDPLREQAREACWFVIEKELTNEEA